MSSRQAIEIRIEGLEEARRALEEVIRASKGAIPEALEMIGQQWETEVKRRAPLRTGRLRRSYVYEVGSGAGGTYVELASNLVYAPFQEFGTRYIVGTPHLRPGTEAVIGDVPRLIVEGISRSRQGFRTSLAGSASGGARLGRRVASLRALGG